MDFWAYDGDRTTIEPADVLRESLGFVDPELPLLIGQVVIMTGLIESKIANIAMSVENKDQNFYLQSFASTNRKVWEKRVSRFDDATLSKETANYITVTLDEARLLLEERNELAHRVWSRATGDTWGGYKGTRRDPKAADGAPLEIGWRDYSPEEIRQIIRRMGECLVHLQSAVGRATSLPRLP